MTNPPSVAPIRELLEQLRTALDAFVAEYKAQGISRDQKILDKVSTIRNRTWHDDSDLDVIVTTLHNYK